MKAKQWIKDYLDFAMPLVMVVVALNLVEVFIKLPYFYNPEIYAPKFSDFFKLNAHLSVFMQQIVTNKFIFATLIFVGIALFLRLFTSRLKIILNFPFQLIWIYAMVNIFINNKINKQTFEMVTFIFIDGLIIFMIFIFVFRILKIFFANYRIIKNIVYITTSIICVLTLLMYQLEIQNIFLIAKWILLIYILFLIALSILYIFIKQIKYIFIKRNENIIMPQDIEQFEIDSKIDFQNTMLDLQDTVDSMGEKRKIKNIIKDLIDYAKK